MTNSKKSSTPSKPTLSRIEYDALETRIHMFEVDIYNAERQLERAKKEGRTEYDREKFNVKRAHPEEGKTE